MPLHLARPTPPGGPLSTRANATARATRLNACWRHQSATAVLEAVLRERVTGRVALVSSFGADAVVLLHLVALIDRHLPVIFLDTGLHFAETLVYQQDVAEALRLTDLRVIRAATDDLAAEDGDGTLHRRDPDACCALRKTRALETALTGFDAWITGRKRHQSGHRSALEVFETDARNGRIKINPLAHWSAADLRDYMENNRLPRHPLIARGYPSVGCAPCTRPVVAGADARSGRWSGSEKTECGIHFDASGAARSRARPTGGTS